MIRNLEFDTKIRIFFFNAILWILQLRTLWFKINIILKSFFHFLTEAKEEQDAVGIYFSEWSRAGVSRMWTGLSDLDANYPKPDSNCDFKYQDNSRRSYSNYADSE